MRIDLYTKGVLTVIAASLMWLCVTLSPVGAPVQAQASSANSRVLIAGWVDSGGGMHSLDPIAGTTYGLPVMMRAGVVPTTSADVGTQAPAATPTRPQTAATIPAPAPRATTPAPASTRVQCQATTQKGAQCKRLAEVGGRYCWQHGRSDEHE